MLNIIVPNKLRMVKKLFTKGSSALSPAHGLGGANATILPFSVSVPPSARKKFWPFNQAGKKEGGWGKGIFARPRLEPVRLWRNPIFPPPNFAPTKLARRLKSSA